MLPLTCKASFNQSAIPSFPFLAERQKYPLCFSSSVGDQVGRVHAAALERGLEYVLLLLRGIMAQSPEPQGCSMSHLPLLLHPFSHQKTCIV